MSFLSNLWERVQSWIATARLAWAVLKQAVRSRWDTDDLFRPKLVKVYAFCEDVDDKLQYRDVTREFEPQTWEEDVRQITGWDKMRIEVRYTQHKHKHRMIVRSGEVCSWPPKKLTMGGDRRKPFLALSAQLQSTSGRARRDVTVRVNKYIGCLSTSATLRVHDMFPFDDCEFESEVFDRLALIDHVLRIRYFSFKNNDAIFDRDDDCEIVD